MARGHCASRLSVNLYGLSGHCYAPIIILGDEPTGNLDKKNSDLVFDIFKRICEEFYQTLLILTHDQSFADNINRIIEMEDGLILKQ